MFDTAVVCTDLSPRSDELIGCAGGLRVLGVRSVVLTHVVDVFADPSGNSVSTRLAEDMFSRQLSELERSGLDVHIEAPMGHPAFSLEEVRRKHEASLIVVDTRRVSAECEMGSRGISSDLMQVSRAPIFVTSPLDPDQRAAHAMYGQMLGNVLFCTDFSETADHAFDQLKRLVTVGARNITLLHVQGQARSRYVLGGPAFESDRSDAVKLARLRESLLNAGAEHVTLEITHGSPAEELARRAASSEYTLVVMGSRGRNRETRSFADSVCDRVVHATTTPLLMVPSARVPVAAG